MSRPLPSLDPPLIKGRLPLLLRAQRQWVIPLGLVLCVIAVYSPLCGYEFINFDDGINVIHNEGVTGFSLDHLRRFWSEPYQSLYIPLVYTVWGLLARLSALLLPGAAAQPHPAIFHAANLLLHGATVVVVFRIVRLLLDDDWAAALGAVLFAVHPVQVEPVAWVTGLKDLLSGALSLLAIWFYLSHAATEGRGRGHGWRYAAATLCFAAALLAKPGTVTTPLLAGTLAYSLLAQRPRTLALELGPWLVLALPVVLVTKVSQPESLISYTPEFWRRFLVAGDALSFYLGKLALPLTLGPDYGRTPQYVLAQPWVYATALLPPLLAILLAWRYPKPWALAASVVFTAALLPVLGFIPFHFQNLSTVADRYLYVAMLAPALAVAEVVTHARGRRGLGLLVAVLLLLLGVKSASQVRVWRNSLTFNSHAVEVNPKSSDSYNNLGLALKEDNRIQEAIAAYQKAIATDPTYSHPYKNLGRLYREVSMPQEAIDYYKKALEIDRPEAEAYMNLGDIAQESGDPLAALLYYKLAVGLKADFATGYAKLGLVYKELERTDEAIAAYRTAIDIDPAFADVYNNLGLVYEASDRETAITMYQKALALKPTLGEAANNLGAIYLGLQREVEAIPLFRKAIAAHPANPLPLNNLGLAYFNLRQFSEAAAWFNKAITVQPTYAPSLNNLSKTYLELGQIQQALSYADQAKGLGLSDPAHLEALNRHRR